MTDEPPDRTGRPRSDAAARLAALLAEIETPTPQEADPVAAPPQPATAVSEPTSDGARRVAAVPDNVRVAAADSPAYTGSVDSSPPSGRAGRAQRTAPRARPTTLRSVAFGLAVVLLALSVPALGYAGSRAILHSRAGTVQAQTNDPHSAGYLGIVDPTPTALVVQRDAQGEPVALTLLSLGNGESGGSVLFIPLDTDIIKPILEIDRLRTVYNRVGNPTFIRQIATLLDIGFGQVINMTDAQLALAVAPVAPLAIQNPDAVVGEGVTFPAGSIEVQANQVGPYLDAVTTGQDDLDRLARHKVLWAAWLHAISTSKVPNPVANIASGIGPFVATLSRGDTNLATLAVHPAAQLSPDGAKTFEVDQEAMRTQITDAVPAPVSPGFGDRYSVEILNGVDGDALPSEVTRRIVYSGGQVNSVGNAAKFGVARTTIEYHDPSATTKSHAKLAAFVLGGGRIEYNPSSTATADLVITIGHDVLPALAKASAGKGGIGG